MYTLQDALIWSLKYYSRKTPYHNNSNKTINIIQIHIYFLKRKFTENVLQNTPSWTIDKKSGEYAPIPLNVVCAVIHYLLFLYKNEYFYNFFLQNFSKILSKTHQIAPFLKIFSGEHASKSP